MENLLDRISIDPSTRIWVSLLLDFMAEGQSETEILSNYPHLTQNDLRAAIAYGAEVARERIVPVPAMTPPDDGAFVL